MTKRSGPSELTLDDLDAAAKEMHDYYFSGVLYVYLICVFLNSEYVQPELGANKAESRKRYSDRVLFAHRAKSDPEAAGLKCTVSGLPATHLIHRGQMPMLTGEGVLNFFPEAIGGFPIAGPYLTALQALPLGGRRSEGKLLFVFSDNQALTLEFARKYLEDNRRIINLTSQNQLPQGEGPDPALDREHAAWDEKKKCPKMPDAKSAPTLVTADLIDVLDRQSRNDGIRYSSLHAYWMSSGKSPSLQVFELPGSLVRFLDASRKADVKPAWNSIIANGWPKVEANGNAAPEKGKRAKLFRIEPGPGRSRNEALNDLCLLFLHGTVDLGRAKQFLRRRVLPIVGKDSGLKENQWAFTELFLEEILGMSPDQIEAIRQFSDKLAAHINHKRDKSLLKALMYAKTAWIFRSVLTKAQRNEYLINSKALFGFNEYLNVFAVLDGSGTSDWGLIRDLISIRLVEKLQEFGTARDLLPSEEEEAELVSEEAF